MLEPGKPAQEVLKYEKGSYFGERALLTNEARAANIIVQGGELVLISLERETFKRILGPIEEILKRNLDLYEKYTKKTN